MNSCLLYHVNRNDIITPEQAAGQTGVQETVKQFLSTKIF